MHILFNIVPPPNNDQKIIYSPRNNLEQQGTNHGQVPDFVNKSWLEHSPFCYVLCMPFHYNDRNYMAAKSPLATSCSFFRKQLVDPLFAAMVLDCSSDHQQSSIQCGWLGPSSLHLQPTESEMRICIPNAAWAEADVVTCLGIAPWESLSWRSEHRTLLSQSAVIHPEEGEPRSCQDFLPWVTQSWTRSPFSEQRG